MIQKFLLRKLFARESMLDLYNMIFARFPRKCSRGFPYESYDILMLQDYPTSHIYPSGLLFSSHTDPVTATSATSVLQPWICQTLRGPSAVANPFVKVPVILHQSPGDNTMRNKISSIQSACDPAYSTDIVFITPTAKALGIKGPWINLWENLRKNVY